MEALGWRGDGNGSVFSQSLCSCIERRQWSKTKHTGGVNSSTGRTEGNVTGRGWGPLRPRACRGLSEDAVLREKCSRNALGRPPLQRRDANIRPAPQAPVGNEKVQKRGARPLGFRVCQLLLNASEKLSFQLKETTCPTALRTRHRNSLGGLPGEMNWTNCKFQNARASSDAFLDEPTPRLCSGKTS